MESPQAVLEMKGIRKHFSENLVLKDVDFTLRAGEVHALLGANGAGKSTLMKIACGILPYDRGQVYVRGKQVQFRSVTEARNAGLAMIHQELSLLKNRCVYENIFMGRELTKPGFPGLLDEKKMIEISRKILGEMGYELDPQRKTADLSVAWQQIVEIAKAVWKKADIIIMDEPTSSLTKQETSQLFQLIGRLKGEGCGIVYISHKIEELFQIADRITVLNQGKVCLEKEMSQVSKEELLYAMTGKHIYETRREKARTGEEILRVEGLGGKGFHNCSLSVRKGEIVSITGIVGAGRSELVSSIFGINKASEGKIFLLEEEVPLHHSPSYSIKKKLGLLPEDRKKQGLIMGMSVERNIVQAALNLLFPRGFISASAVSEQAGKYGRQALYQQEMEKLPEKLSGGNQQKVVLAKWLCTNCQILIFDEPTKGIDAAAREEIYRLMEELARQGKGILMVSSDQREVLQMSDRVYVMKQGTISRELKREEITEEKIISAEF